MARLLWILVYTAGVFLAGLGIEEMLGLLGPKAATYSLATGLLFLLAYYLWKKFEGSNKQKVGFLVIGTVGALIFAWKVPPLLPSSTVDEGRVQLALQYAYEWDNYKGATIKPPENWWRTIGGSLTREYSPSEMRLLLGVYNGNKKVSLENIRVHINFIDDWLIVRPDKYWQPYVTNKHYFVSLGNVNRDEALFPNGNLWVKFPKPGVYSMTYFIRGGNFDSITHRFEIILRKPTSDTGNSQSQ